MKRMEWVLGFVLLASMAGAQQQPISQMYRRDIVEARTIAVVADPKSSAQDSQENQRARLDVQNALRSWGKYEVVADPKIADLIMVVRKGHAQAATIGGGSTTPPPVVVDPTDSGIHVSVHRGQNQPLSQTDSTQISSQPQRGSEAGSPEDLLEVYRGSEPLPGDASREKTQYPLDEVPVWSYTATDALRAPRVEGVVVFRKAVEAAAKKTP